MALIEPTSQADTQEPEDDDATIEQCITPRDALEVVRRFAVAGSPAHAAGIAAADAQRVRRAVAQADDILGTRRRIAQAEQRDDDAIDLALAQMMLSFACAFLPRPPERVVLPEEGA